MAVVAISMGKVPCLYDRPWIGISPTEECCFQSGNRSYYLCFSWSPLYQCSFLPLTPSPLTPVPAPPKALRCESVPMFMVPCPEPPPNPKPPDPLSQPSRNLKGVLVPKHQDVPPPVHGPPNPKCPPNPKSPNPAPKQP